MPRKMKGTMPVTTFTEGQIAVPLSEPEVSAKANELADVCGQIDKLRADAAEHAGSERKKVRALELRRRQLAECVRTRTEMQAAQTDLELDRSDKKRRNGRELDH